MRQGRVALPGTRHAGMGADRGDCLGGLRTVGEHSPTAAHAAFLMSKTLELTRELMARASVSPTDGGCQTVMIERLELHGFEAERLPFVPEIADGMLYGRGAADMKSGLAAMVTASEDFVRQYPKHLGTIAFLITSDEEGPS